LPHQQAATNDVSQQPLLVTDQLRIGRLQYFLNDMFVTDQQRQSFNWYVGQRPKTAIAFICFVIKV